MTQHLGTETNPAGLISQAQRLLAEALARYREPDAYARLARFTVEQASIDWGTVWGAGASPPKGTARPPDLPFPVLIRNIEQLSRTVTAIQTIMAGFASSAYYSDVERVEIFGMPAGKPAFRNIAEYLRDTLCIPLRQAKARVKLAAELAPAPSFDGGHVPESRYPEVAQRFFEAVIDSSAAEIVVDTVNQVQREAAQAKVLTPEVQDRLDTGQQHLTAQATQLDPDGLRQVAKRWSQHTTYWFNQDGVLTDEVVDRKRGPFIAATSAVYTTGCYA